MTETEIEKLLADFEAQIEQIHLGKYPNWEKFFSDALVLENEYFQEHGASSALSDELLSVYELLEVEGLFSDDGFIEEISKIVSTDIHFICFLFACSYESQISTSNTSKLVTATINLESLDCEGCSINRWWGNPLAYLADSTNIQEEDLKKVFEASKISLGELDKDVAFCALAHNPRTPRDILEFLATQNRRAILLENEDCQFYSPDNPESSNISYWAKERLATGSTHLADSDE
jgi:hypothetical protein